LQGVVHPQELPPFAFFKKEQPPLLPRTMAGSGLLRRTLKVG
jgi:hypothetical protein